MCQNISLWLKDPVNRRLKFWDFINIIRFLRCVWSFFFFNILMFWDLRFFIQHGHICMLWLAILRSRSILHSSQINKKELFDFFYVLFKFKSNCLVAKCFLFTFLSASTFIFSVIMAAFSVILAPFFTIILMTECSVT